MEEMGYEKTCVFGYKAKWERSGGSIVAENCLHSEPTWMEEMKDQIQDLQLKYMVLPGSHDSGSYTKSGKLYSLTAGSIFTQEEDFLSQLLWGIRFFDIRPGTFRAFFHEDFGEETADMLYKLFPKYWVSHNSIPTHFMQTVIDQTKEFLKNTREIVIWSCIGFRNALSTFDSNWMDKGYDDEFSSFTNYLTIEFKDWLVKPEQLNWDKTVTEVLNDPTLKSGEGRIILTSDKDKTYPLNMEIWFPFIIGAYNNPQTIDDSWPFLNEQVKKSKSFYEIL